MEVSPYDELYRPRGHGLLHDGLVSPSSLPTTPGGHCAQHRERERVSEINRSGETHMHTQHLPVNVVASPKDNRPHSSLPVSLRTALWDTEQCNVDL